LMPEDRADPREEPIHQEMRREDPLRTGLWSRLRRLLRRYFVEPLVLSRNPPWFDARGVAIGLIVGFGTPIGSHCVATLLLRSALRFNLIVALAFSWVCNPFNVIFLYYGYYYLGSIILGKPSMDYEVFRGLLDPIAQESYFWETLYDFVRLGKDLLLRWTIAAIVLAVISGVLGYVVTLRVQTARCKRRAYKMGVNYEKFVKEMEEKAAAEKW
jgi:uncharacterized protein